MELRSYKMYKKSLVLPKKYELSLFTIKSKNFDMILLTVIQFDSQVHVKVLEVREDHQAKDLTKHQAMPAVELQRPSNSSDMLVMIRIMYLLPLEPMLGLEVGRLVDIVARHNDPKLLCQLQMNVFNIRMSKTRSSYLKATNDLVC